MGVIRWIGTLVSAIRGNVDVVTFLAGATMTGAGVVALAGWAIAGLVAGVAFMAAGIWVVPGGDS